LLLAQRHFAGVGHVGEGSKGVGPRTGQHPVDPSTAITRISFGFTARSAAQPPRMRSRPFASILLMRPMNWSGCHVHPR